MHKGLLITSISAITVILLFAAVADPGQTGANIYKITINSRDEAAAASHLGMNAFLRVSDGYLVQALSSIEYDLAQAGINYQLIATDIIRSRLALDVRRDRSGRIDYPILYDDDGLRLYNVDPQIFKLPAAESGLTPLLSDNLLITYRPSRSLDLSRLPDMVDLDSLAASALVDSCQSYVERLQDFQTRMIGTDSNYASRDWLIDKFHDFGYDSVVTDTFMANTYYDSLYLSTCHNVIAYKIGTTYPDHQIVIGAHRDSYPLASPGADDNASGTSGVLEIARVLSGLETKMTFVFVLFDAEETGLFGAWHYADRAFRNGDSIALMINMDVIGYYENADSATVGQAPWIDYGDLYRQLADSLPSIDLRVDVPSNAYWDGAPFQINGHNAITAFEYNINHYLHSDRDSTTYMNFDYMTRIIRGSLVTAYVVNDTYIPAPMLEFDYPDGRPGFLYPGTAAAFDVLIEGYAGGVLEPGSAEFHYALNGGEFEVSPLSEIGGDLYRVTFPAFACNSRVAYYISARESEGESFYSVDPDNPHEIATGLGAEVIAEYDFENYYGWLVYGTATQGLWSPWRPRGRDLMGRVPIDYDGSGFCFVTGPEPEPWQYEGGDVDNGVTILKSPSLNLTGGQVLVEYAIWYSNNAGEAPFSDVFEVKISGDDGATWTTAETIGPVIHASGRWYRYRFWANDFMEPTAQMRLRFDASDYGDASNIEAGVDAIKITRFSCGQAVSIVTDGIEDWTEGMPMSTALEVSGGHGTISWADVNNDLEGAGLSLSSEGVLAGTPSLAAPITFTASATDELGQFDQRQYSFIVNPAPAILTDTLPDGTIGVAYAQQLSASGGTGPLIWNDLDADLEATGLELSPEGLLSGVPSDTGTIAFIAEITDAVGAAVQKPFSVFVNVPYICGDANGDGDVNVGDAVFLINYVFKSGPAPVPLEAGDANWDGDVNVADAVFVINYVFKGGPAPEC